MPKSISLQVTAKLDVSQTPSLMKEGLWIHLVKAQTTVVVGKGQCDKNGQAVIKFKMLADTAPKLEAIVSPLSTLKNKIVRTEKAALSAWSNKAGVWQANSLIPLTRGFAKSADWLHEEFLVTGHLYSVYEDPETEEVINAPVRDAKIRMYEVDKVSIGSGGCTPCKPGIVVDCAPAMLCDPITHIECIPDNLCTPSTTLCKPNLVCPPVQVCIPKYQCKPTCVPSLPGICTPSEKPVIDDIWKYEKDYFSEIGMSGCCGAEKTAEVQLRAISVPVPEMKPLKSPALKSLDLTKDTNIAYMCAPTGTSCIVTNTKSQLGTDCETDANGYFSFTFKRIDFFDAPSPTTHTEDKDWDEMPDLLFEARLWLDGEYRVVYKENYINTRWNQGTYTHVNLFIEGMVPSADPMDPDVDITQTEQFLFHGVGNIEPGWIADDGVIRNNPAGTWNQYVFGGGMDIMGQFKYEHVGKYYQVEYQRDGESDWHPVLGESWPYSVHLGGGHWESRIKAPESVGAYPACYQIPDYASMNETQKTKLIVFSSYRSDGNIKRYPNGLYHLRVRLLERSGDTMTPAAGFNPDANRLHVRIDNSWPLAAIQPTLYVGDLTGTTLNVSAVAECGLAHRGANRYLLINFNAVDMENHFLQYEMMVNRGADGPARIPASGLPAAGLTTAPALPGFAVSAPYATFTTDSSLVSTGNVSYSTDPNVNFSNAYVAMYMGADPWLPWVSDGSGHVVPQPLRPCAYNFRLAVWDRVTNGYGHVHRSEHNMTLTILE